MRPYPSPAGLLALFFLAALAPATGWGHASLVRSSPARRAVLSAPPARVQLWFSEQLEAPFSRLSVWDARGTQVDLRDIRVDSDDRGRLSVGLPDLPAGTYTVRFRVLSVDGHVVESQFAFTIQGSR